MLTARTLMEADIYVALTRAQEGAEPGVELTPAPGFEPGVNLTEGPDAWTYASPVGDITIPYASEKSATLIGAHWGLGRSRLIDAAEWTAVGRLYWERGVEADMAYNGEPGKERDLVALNFAELRARRGGDRRGDQVPARGGARGSGLGDLDRVRRRHQGGRPARRDQGAARGGPGDLQRHARGLPGFVQRFLM